MLPRMMLVAFLAATSTSDAQPKGLFGPAVAAAQLEQLTQRRFDANAANDRSFYEGLLASNFLVLQPFSPPQTKKEYLDGEFLSQSAGHRGGRATVSDFRALVDGDTAVVSYRVIEPTLLGAQRFESHQMRLDTYVRIKGAWRLLCMAVAMQPTWPEVATIDPKLFEEYAGTYQLAADAFIEVTNEAGHLMLEQTGQAKAELLPEDATTFFDRSDSPLARSIFERDSSGKVVALIYRAEGQQVRANKIRSSPAARQ